MFKFFKRLFKKKNKVLIDMNSIDNSLSMSMAGHGDCSDQC